MTTVVQTDEVAYREQVIGAIRKLIATNSLQIPPYPAMAVRLTQLLEQQDFSIHSVVDLVKNDQALSAQVLRYANSAITGLRREVTSLDRAITFMGVEQLLSLACVAGLQPSIAAAGVLTEVRRAIWSRTILRAQAAETIAKYRGIKSDNAFLCGLLCDFGKVVTIRCIEQILSKQPNASAMPMKFWLGIIQIYEAEVGLIVSEKWRLPALLQEVMRSIARHENTSELVGTVLAADQVAGLLRSQPCVTVEDLAGRPHFLDAREREYVASAIPKIVEASARLCPEPPPAPKRPVPTKVVAPELRWKSHPLQLDVEVRRSSNALRYQTTVIAYDGIEIQGRDLLPTQELIRVVLQTPSGELSAFATVTAATPDARGSRMALSFFALSREQKAMWDSVVKHAAAGRPATPQRT